MLVAKPHLQLVCQVAGKSQACLYLLGLVLTDISYTLVDPRVRLR